jgi:hypothetical protein
MPAFNEMKEAPMVKRITVQGIQRQEFDVKAFVYALVELARSTSQPVSDDSPIDENSKQPRTRQSQRPAKPTPK